MGKLSIKVTLKLVTAAFLFLTGAANAVDSTSSTFPRIDETSGAASWKPHLGLQAGYANPEYDYNAAVEYGIDVGFQPFVPFGLGFEVSTLSSDGQNDQDLDRTKAMVRGTYNFGGTNEFIRISYVGLGLGAVWDSVGNDDAVNLGMAPTVGFDYPIAAFGGESRYLSLGANAKYLIVGANMPDTFSLNGQMKYWF